MNRRDRALQIKQRMRELESRLAAQYKSPRPHYGEMIRLGLALKINGHRLNRLKRQARDEIRERPKPSRVKHDVRHLAR